MEPHGGGVEAGALVAVEADQVQPFELADGDIIYPGTNVRIVAVPGLTSTNRIVATYLGNLFYGTDLLSDEENFEFEYTRTGVRYTAPSGLHDDCVMALALAVDCKAHNRPGTFYFA